MNKDQIKGAVKEAAGKVQQKAGEIVDSPKTVAKGIAKQDRDNRSHAGLVRATAARQAG